MSNTDQCRANANWKKIGTKTVYRVPIHPDCGIIEHLGAIKPRTDSRWSWWRWKSKFHKWIEGQGVAASQGAAEMRVLEGWDG